MGMAMFYSIWYFLWVRFGALFTIYYAMFPFIECVTFFGGISYLWHGEAVCVWCAVCVCALIASVSSPPSAWCDPNDINNPYVDSVTIVDGKDNIFNEDYHVVHHTKPFAHWTEYRQLYEDNIADYQKYNATIFRDCEEVRRKILFLSPLSLTCCRARCCTGCLLASGILSPSTWLICRAR